jgi:hypothetical protein
MQVPFRQRAKISYLPGYGIAVLQFYTQLDVLYGNCNNHKLIMAALLHIFAAILSDMYRYNIIIVAAAKTPVITYGTGREICLYQ